MLLAFCASQRRRLRKPEPPRARTPGGQAEPTHDLQRENDALGRRSNACTTTSRRPRRASGASSSPWRPARGPRRRRTTTRENEALQATIQRLNDQLERATAPGGRRVPGRGHEHGHGRPRGPRARVRRVEFEFRVGVGRRGPPPPRPAPTCAGRTSRDPPGRITTAR